MSNTSNSPVCPACGVAKAMRTERADWWRLSIPLAIFGAFVVLGSIMVVTNSLPWELKQTAALQERLTLTQITTISDNQRTLAAQLASLSGTIATLTATVAALNERTQENSRRIDDAEQSRRAR